MESCSICTQRKLMLCRFPPPCQRSKSAFCKKDHVIENFHGWEKCRAWAQTVDATDYERQYDVCDYIMINAALGFTVNRVVLLQKLFRSAKKHKVRLALAGSAPNGRLPLEAQCCIAEFAWRSPNNKIPRSEQFRIKRWAIPGIEWTIVD